mmetsp:Transcript_20462/g.28557  ORF Transcript_20462/g.28557 Transcript_20462/m.28557 type:complete len:690 (+) Transcript_20462:268-2337(+)|eukprot:CAMPEP_0184485160 /NCGR_PEP_ID=MMETSP0113_2-20130426/6805_1 /TAXON_ID=91329 /ORGANISM="Norrisiella sphaerica, Strain BC52" /LENGTH=689 /DNA_ID=CAMNT_0026866487 /DNA_START=263 /DNA_END=2332 /DNA_ORIENTATION=-
MSSQRVVDGIVCLEVLKGRKLTDKALMGKQSPYLIIKIGDKRLVTKVDNRGGLEPKWNQAFEFNVPKNINQKLYIEVWSKNTFSDTIIGKRAVLLYDFWKKSGESGGWWRIHSKQYIHKIRGEIFFRIKVNGKSYMKTHSRRPSAQVPNVVSAPPAPSEPNPKMIWEIAIPAGVSVRTKPSLSGPKVTMDGKNPIILPRGTLLDSSVIHKSYVQLKGGKHLATYWIRHAMGWSCCKYGHSQTAIPVCEFKIFEVVGKQDLTVRTTPGLGAPRTEYILHPGQVVIGKQVQAVTEAKAGKSTWVLHDHGWSCSSIGKDNHMVQIMFRKAFQVCLRAGVTIREKPSLKAKIIDELKHLDYVVARDITANKEENRERSVWLKTLGGWSCLQLGDLVTMIPVGQGQAWWQVTASALSIRYNPGKDEPKTKHVLHKGDFLVSRGLYPLPFEKAQWLKLNSGFSCYKLGPEELMRLKCGVELWQVTNEAGLYIRAKPGGKKHILGYLPKGELILSRYMVTVLDDDFPPTVWVRHGRGWTCIKLGDRFLAAPVIPGDLQHIKQKPVQTFNLKQLMSPSAPAVVHYDHYQPDIKQPEHKALAAAPAESKTKAVPLKVLGAHHRSEEELHNVDAPPDFEDIPEAEGVAVVVGAVQVLNPAIQPAAAPPVFKPAPPPRTSSVEPQPVKGEQHLVTGEVVG